VRHLSVRVPWHDAGWDGTICRFPAGNASCLILKRIRDQRDDAKEVANSGQSWVELPDAERPPCHAENVAFMLPREQLRTLTHAYANSSPAHRNLLPTPLRMPAYSASAVPFRWMLRENARTLADEHGIVLAEELERQADEMTGFKSTWTQAGPNQARLLDAFFSAVRPEQSLVFFYAKRTPLTEDTRRVLIGVGRVTGVAPTREFRAGGQNRLETRMWEHPVIHSIRPGHKDGFLLPYHDIMALAEKDPTLDTERFVAFAPDDHWNEFSFGSEHVSHDAAITALLSCAAALRECATLVQGDWEGALRWIDARLNELWQMRGPCPGLGSALTAFGIDQGNFVAYDINNALEENEDPWPAVEQALADPSLLGLGLDRRISATMSKVWQALPQERRALLKLLSRFAITADQAKLLYEPARRREHDIDVDDSDILANPYLIYELTRHVVNPVTLSIVDRGLFPDAVVRDKHPLPLPSSVDDGADPRRVRGVLISILERAAASGDTLVPRDRIISEVEAETKALPQPCPIGEDLLNALEPDLAPVVIRVQLSDNSPAYQLDRLGMVRTTIAGTVERRLNARRHTVAADWEALLAKALSDAQDPQDEDERATEARARQEKEAALAELAGSRISVLIGPAGTGKTTLLNVLSNQPGIRSGGVLLLAPTGKARVRLGQSTGLRARTIAEFLVGLDRYDGDTGRYRFDGKGPEAAGKTVIIDEASMLTEEQLAATIRALKDIERLILVGDPRQLPPIGSGRPFVDIVTRLRPENVEGVFPRVGPGYAELTIRRRQVGEARDDLLLADWFSGEAPDPGADEIWDRIEGGVASDRIRLVPWSSDLDLQETLIHCLVDELKLAGPEDEANFGLSLGGSLYGERVFYWPKRGSNRGAAEGVENWQILTPVRGRAYGTGEVNRTIQRQFRAGTLQWAESRGRKVPPPFGIEEIVYGDKVIQTTNQRRRGVWPEQGALRYVANGEIGIAVGQYKRKNASYKGLPWELEVEFSSQTGFAYKYRKGEFGDEGNPPLELAYAITVHKAQGSEFGTTFLILPQGERWYSRELLYTALTRQRDRIILLHQGDLSDLKRLADPQHSETARRLTNLFKAPELVRFDSNLFLEGNLIHRTQRGETVRSKSEVIIADTLHHVGLDYSYEQRLVGADGSVRYPDFTIDDAETGEHVYWEHLGLLHDAAYRTRWERKLDWYRMQGILTVSEGGGDAGALVTSEDSPDGGIDSRRIRALIKEVLGR
jgi:hypothetical protein